MIIDAVVKILNQETPADIRLFGSRHLQCNLNKNLKALEYVFL